MKYWVGVTDNGWFRYLRDAEPEEVNFWQPSCRPPFVHLEPGAPFLFKLKHPHNHVAGGGYFVKFSTLPMSMVWDAFEDKNGAATRSGFETMIRRLMADPRAKDPYIGCTVLTAPFFWPEDQWIQAPRDWARNSVRGRYYDTGDLVGAALWKEVSARQAGEELAWQEPGPRYGQPTLQRTRLGQGAFRVLVTDAYQRRCAVTGERTLPVLEAAHILPYAEEGPHEVTNGLLLRSDFHKLFEAGLLTVTPQLNIEISPSIREEWFNGKAYYRLHGQPLATLPENPAERPSATFLAWHNENRFRA